MAGATFVSGRDIGSVTIHSVADDTVEPSPPDGDRRPLPTRLIVALVGAGVLVGGVAGGVAGALLRPGSGGHAEPTAGAAEQAAAPTYTDEQVAEARANVCAAYGKVHQAVLINTGRNGDDPASIFAIAANARIALYDGGGYLLTKLEQAPATPTDLADGVRALAAAYQQLAIDYLAEVPDEEQQAALQAVDATNAPVFGMCQ